MKLRILGCAGSESPGRNAPAFLVDDVLLLDGGTIGAVLPEDAQNRITDVLLSHPHHDHVRGLPSFIDNLVAAGTKEPITIRGSAATLDAVQKHLFNGVIWPDFSRLPCPEAPIIRWQPVVPLFDFQVRDYRVAAFPVKHSVPAFAYRLQCEKVSLLYTGDMGPTPELWRAVGTVTALIIEVSFPDELEALAQRTGHLTASLLAKELALLPRLPVRIFICHLKPVYEEQIRREIAALKIPGLSILSDDQELSL
jgi:ribonuclease BN (tRNA processing enzyme)